MIPLQSVPDMLSYVRVAAAPLLVVCAFTLPEAWKDNVLFALFLVAVLTDFLDGQLAARNWRQRSVRTNHGLDLLEVFSWLQVGVFIG